MRELIPAGSLAVLPDTTHTGLLRRADLLLPMVEKFLAEQPEAATGGSAGG
ncbi:MAG TPA: hypothetical protein VNP03_19715 [Pseudonocardia sp.]|nr:hypothetical protein [Pseudonocardia sp.]